MEKKGQAAMEFLMTYGWAILVVLAAIGALAYFGVLNPSKWTPDQCVFGPEFGTCPEYKVVAGSPGTIEVAVNNQLQESIDLFNMTFTSADCTTSEVYSNTNVTANGRRVGGGLITFTCAEDLSAGTPVKGTFNVVYKKQGDTLTHTSEGQFVAKAE